MGDYPIEQLTPEGIVNDPEQTAAFVKAVGEWAASAVEIMKPAIKRFEKMFVVITYEHPVRKHNGRRRSNREQRDIAKQEHKIYLLGNAVIKRK